jgi:hypothetical protein
MREIRIGDLFHVEETKEELPPDMHIPDGHVWNSSPYFGFLGGSNVWPSFFYSYMVRTFYDRYKVNLVSRSSSVYNQDNAFDGR